jgi:hypothetical protein
MKRNSRGFAATEVIIVIAIAVIVGIIGYLIFNKTKDDQPTASVQPTGTNVPAAPEVQDTSDLDAASKALDETDIDASAQDTTQLETQVNDL